MDTVYVPQRDRYDCVIAAAAMFVGVSYEQAFEAAEPYYRPRKVKGRYGVRDVNATLNGLVSPDKYRGLWLPLEFVSPHFVRQLLWGRRALITTPSLNTRGGMHVVYYDGHRVYDPQQPPKKVYQDFEELTPTEAWIWREGEPTR